MYHTKTINIVYLYAELQPYVIVVLQELVKQKGVTIHVVHWDKKRLTPYVAPHIDQVYYYDRSQFENTHGGGIQSLYQMIEKIEPTVIYTSGWMDKIYMAVCKKIQRMRSIPIIAGSDTKWHGGKQWLNVLAAPFFHKKCFSHIQVAGIWQYEYARRLGFSQRCILMHNLSADVEIFHNVNIQNKKEKYPRRLLYIGRFSPEKGLKYLIDAWNSIIDRKLWVLTLIGNGPEKESMINNKDVEVFDFMQQKELTRYMQNSGCFILPSIKEPWAVVLHEAAAGGLPILASNICGAVPYFVINNYNGFTFAPANSLEIKIAIEKIINTSEEKLIEMSYNSRKLSERITPEIVAKTMLSVIQES
jgi:glycosyltransferase involved in cell wall biosynthesis